MGLIVKNLSKTYKGKEVLCDIHLHIRKKEIHAVVGPSGSGKTTLLQTIAGIVSPDSGEIAIHGRDIVNTVVRERRIGYVFQEYALFPHLTARKNIEYGLKAAGKNKGDIEIKCAAMLNLVDLKDHAGKKPSELSGGQQQRLALARTLALEPELVLLDEPFAHYDIVLRNRIASQMREILQGSAATVLLVTHNPEDAAELADSVSVLHSGKIVESGSVTHLARQPQTEFSGAITGGHTEFEVRVVRNDAETAVACFSNGKVKSKILLKSFPYYTDNKTCCVGIRMADIKISEATCGSNCFTGKVLRCKVASGGYSLLIDVNGIVFTVLSSQLYQIDDTLSLYLPPESFYPICGKGMKRKTKHERSCKERRI